MLLQWRAFETNRRAKYPGKGQGAVKIAKKIMIKFLSVPHVVFVFVLLAGDVLGCNCPTVMSLEDQISGALNADDPVFIGQITGIAESGGDCKVTFRFSEFLSSNIP